ncbi:uncharacterized protein LOC126080692 [Elephas maximus indicus]|uniref:uncharacterized protein LOC126080692 n=1 Tax=Elephas maximus indicus TaxID=99487 RepID=UPI002116F225|nr:uncharacterized protein LOC126080692 [Elephas maximus indicus]
MQILLRRRRPWELPQLLPLLKGALTSIFADSWSSGSSRWSTAGCEGEDGSGLIGAGGSGSPRRPNLEMSTSQDGPSKESEAQRGCTTCQGHTARTAPRPPGLLLLPSLWRLLGQRRPPEVIANWGEKEPDCLPGRKRRRRLLKEPWRRWPASPSSCRPEVSGITSALAGRRSRERRPARSLASPRCHNAAIVAPRAVHLDE